MHRAFILAVIVAVVHPGVRADDVDFVRDVRPILQEHCYSCHGATKQKSGLRLDVKSEAFKGGDGYGPSVIADKPDESPLIELVSSEDESTRMPPKGAPLSTREIQLLRRWIETGAVWPENADLVKLKDPLDHWSFKKPNPQPIPTSDSSQWADGAIDRFILARLHQENLTPAPLTSPSNWLRRTTLDLTGLPPTPSEVVGFLAELETSEAAYSNAINRLLNSPRYGERWAQHWLDVVRYADTHGFEVNTERPNAWPYRDYVIAAFNRDTPYDRFIKEQIAGDALGVDAATGFLVTASVLLPGQIGKDAPSIRLARQDSLDEIVNNIGQTFLGLSVGCARCHDHKFDPISARDYYAMQAFVAGVEYADRKIRSPESARLNKEAESLRDRVTDIKRQLDRFAPLACPKQEHEPSSDVTKTNAKENTETFEPLSAKFVRFTIHDSNLHPSLGLIEPCLDEFEVFTDEANPRNIASVSQGTTVTASGSRSSANHKLQHINDGKYGNSRSWMADTSGNGWVQFEFPAATRIAKVVWSRDRTGRYTDRLATAYTLQAGLTPDSLVTLKHVPALRPSVRASQNTDRFLPVRAQRLRFSVLATNDLAPCIDELEVFNTDGQNIALAHNQTNVTTSSDHNVGSRHKPQFINDGKYGNSSSWMSDEPGKGWVELKFSKEHEIERVVWGRDRDGKFKDRLPTQYRIEVAMGEKWKRVADSTDRRPWIKGNKRDDAFTTTGLPPEEKLAAERLLNEKKKTESRIKVLEAGQQAFAGKFRKPDVIHLLRRGDPEQPAEKVSPAGLSAISELVLPVDTDEQERRKALADWITSPQNPLTARVMVNRIWQWHFGIGLVDTPNDFGHNGVEPSHPELLDWLAEEFIQSGWSIKHMHRLILLSSTYRQSTRYDAHAADIDADVRLLWRYPPRRLEAEAIRDCILAVSGTLNLKMGGRGFDLFNKRGGLSGFSPVESFKGEGLRRMVYAHKVRRERDAVFGAFDCPDAGQSTPRRIQSTTPIQALNLLNSRVTIEQANAFASRVQHEVGDDVATQIHRVYTLALNREPDANEIDDAEPLVREHGLATLCRVLFNSNEFLFFP